MENKKTIDIKSHLENSKWLKIDGGKNGVPKNFIEFLGLRAKHRNSHRAPATNEYELWDIAKKSTGRKSHLDNSKWLKIDVDFFAGADEGTRTPKVAH